MFDTHPYRVIKIDGSAITVMRNNREITRNVAHTKKVPNYVSHSDGWDSDDDSVYYSASGDGPEIHSHSEDDDTVDADTEAVELNAGDYVNWRPVRDRRRPNRYTDNWNTKS